jgi:hypothetical protein
LFNPRSGWRCGLVKRRASANSVFRLRPAAAPVVETEIDIARFGADQPAKVVVLIDYVTRPFRAESIDESIVTARKGRGTSQRPNGAKINLGLNKQCDGGVDRGFVRKSPRFFRRFSAVQVGVELREFATSFVSRI